MLNAIVKTKIRAALFRCLRAAHFMMFNAVLFLGFPLLDSYQRELSKLSAVERELFIQYQVSPYLQQIQSEGALYLGKGLGSSVELAALDSFQSHIYSLLRKLVPDFPYQQHPLLLLILPTEP